MERKQRKVVFIALLFIVLLGGAFFAIAGLLSSGGDQITCSGTVEVDLFGIGQPAFDSKPQCTRDPEPCSGFGQLFSFLPVSEEGSVNLIVTNQVVAAQNWDSTFGENVPFTITSACITDPASVTVKVYSDDGIERDSETVTLG